MHAGGALPSLGCCAAGCQRGRLRFHRAAVNASPGPPHIDTSSPNTHPSSQPTPNRMRAVPADQLPAQDRPRAWWGSGSWPVLRWQRSYPPNCARITSRQRAPSSGLGCPLGTWVMGVSFSCLPFSACCHHAGPFLVSLAELPGEISGAGLVILAAPACGTGGGRELRRVGGHTQAPDLSGSHNRPGAAAATPERRVYAPTRSGDWLRSGDLVAPLGCGWMRARSRAAGCLGLWAVTSPQRAVRAVLMAVA